MKRQGRKNPNFYISNRKLSMVSLGKVVPSAITLMALCIGLTSIKVALAGRLDLAVLCILVSAFLDMLDGRVARYLGSSSQFGAELDSLSDLVCFGVCPSVLIYLISLKYMDNLGWAMSLYFAVCSALRLARFNVAQINSSIKQNVETVSEEAKLYFTGVPAPAGAMLCLLPAIAFLCFSNKLFLSPYFCAFTTLVSGTLMVSKMHTFSSKMIKISSHNMPVALLIISTVMILLIMETWATLLTLLVAYIISFFFSEKSYRKILSQNRNDSSV